MAQYRTPNDLNIPGLVCEFNYVMDSWVFELCHRNIILRDWFDRWEVIKLDNAYKIICGMRDAINYYLDAIWC